MNKNVLETVRKKLDGNTYVMSCYLKQDDLYAEMKEHLRMLTIEIETCHAEIEDQDKKENYYLEAMKDIRNRIHINDKDQIENNLNETIRGLYRK